MHDGCNHGSAETANAPAAAPQGGPARRSAYWRSVEQLANTPEFQAYMHREFQPGAAEATEEERRTFIKMMGASFALAGLAAASEDPHRLVDLIGALPPSAERRLWIVGTPEGTEAPLA